MLKITLMIKMYLMDSKIRKNVNTYNFELMHLSVLKRFFEIENIINASDLNTNEIYNLVLYLKERGNSNNTINKKISLLKRVYKFNNIDNKDLFEFKKLKEVIKHYDILDEEKLKKLLMYVNNNSNTDIKKLVDKTIVYLLLDTGIRRTELLNLKVRNIDFEQKIILLTETKTKIERIILFTKFTYDLLKSLVDINPNREYLFVNFKTNERINGYYLRDLFEKMDKVLGFKVRPHMCRHTMATMLIENGCSLSSVQKLLGHSSLKTTEIYLHMSFKKIKEEYEKCFPTLIYN